VGRCGWTADKQRQYRPVAGAENVVMGAGVGCRAEFGDRSYLAPGYVDLTRCELADLLRGEGMSAKGGVPLADLDRVLD